MFLLVFSGMSKDNQDFLTKHVTISLVVSVAPGTSPNKNPPFLADRKRLRTTNSLGSQGRQVRDGPFGGVHHVRTNRYMIKSTLKIARCCGTLGDSGFLQKFLGLFQVIMANPVFGTLT